MKEGAIVKVSDGSYSKMWRNGKLHDSHGVDLKDQHWQVIAVACVLPAWGKGERNDTILQSLDKEEIVFIQGRFLRLTCQCEDKICPTCGRRKIKCGY